MQPTVKPSVAPLAPLTHARRVELFGFLPFKAEPRFGNPEGIRVDREWVEHNIREVNLPQLRRLDAAHRVTHPINVHWRMEKPILALWAEWERLGFMRHIHTWNGSWVPRLKRGRTTPTGENLSNHAWGTAFDINARYLPLGKPVPADSPMFEMARVANQFGFAWGGDFKGRVDGMHFELVVAQP